jgi:hypothetical protein
LAMRETDTVAAALEPFIERLPGDTGGLHGDQQLATMVFDRVISKGVLHHRTLSLDSRPSAAHPREPERLQ